VTFPTQLVTVTVRGHFMRLDGSPARGRVTFTPLRQSSSTTLNFIIVDDPVHVILDVDGLFEITVPAGDDPNIVGNLYLRVDQQIESNIVTYIALVPSSAQFNGIDITDLEPVTDVPDFVAYVMQSAVGQPGGVAPLDITGHVPADNLPSVSSTIHLAELADVNATAVLSGTPMILRRDTNGIYRLESLASATPIPWSDQVRYATHDPDDLTAPNDVVWVNCTNGSVYRSVRS
jgi:hypothetical protein